VTRAGSPLGSYWCSAWATAVWEDAGADVPTSLRAVCEAVRLWAAGNGTLILSSPPKPGYLVLYRGADQKAHHVGIIIRSEPYLISAEGNAPWAGESNNGEAVLLRRVRPTSQPVMGYVRPMPRVV
jgi:hypothetical protein